MRKLTVKNFSVIKDAELEFGKITVLIGPQSSGKSLLCKLAYFLSRRVLEIAIDRVVKRYQFADFTEAVISEFIRWFPVGGWGEGMWSIVFRSQDFQIALCAPLHSEPGSNPTVTVDSAFEIAYETRLRETLEEQDKRGFLIPPALESLAATALMRVAGHGIWDSNTYIPMERSYFVDTARGYKALGVESDPVAERFATVFVNSMNSTIERPRVSRYLQGEVSSVQSTWMFAFQDKRFLPINELSSGSKELLPLLVVLDYYEQQRRRIGNLASEQLGGVNLYLYDDFTIEEPESSVFPHTQYDLVREVAALANETTFQPRFVLTTHSPYVMTAFNTLIEAGRVGSRLENREKVVSLIPEEYWIQESDFKAYAMQDGKLVSIFKPEAEDPERQGMINGDYLDSVSDQLGKVFSRLLDIEFAE